MPPKGYRKIQPVTDTPDLLASALLIVNVLRGRDPQSMDLAMAVRGLEAEQRKAAEPSTDEGGK